MNFKTRKILGLMLAVIIAVSSVFNGGKIAVFADDTAIENVSGGGEAAGDTATGGDTADGDDVTDDNTENDVADDNITDGKIAVGDAIGITGSSMPIQGFAAEDWTLGDNLATVANGASATASSGNAASIANGINGDRSSNNWGTASTQHTNGSYPGESVWYQIDLGSEKSFNTIIFVPRLTSIMRGARIQYSVDSSSWEDAYVFGDIAANDADNGGNTVSRTISTVPGVSAPAGSVLPLATLSDKSSMSARYVKFTTTLNSAGTQPKIYSFEVYNATENSGPPPSLSAPVFTSPASNATINGQILLKGTCESGVTAVEIYEDGEKIGDAVIDLTDNTKWSYKYQNLDEGSHTITAKAIKSSEDASADLTVTVAAPLEDLAWTRPVASAIGSTQSNATYAYSKAFDGDLSTYWAPASSQYNSTVMWCGIDLGSPQAFDSIVLSIRKSNTMRSIKIEGSADNSTWTPITTTPTIPDVTANDSPTSVKHDLSVASPVTYRYVRYSFESGTGIQQPRVCEFEIYNASGGDPTGPGTETLTQPVITTASQTVKNKSNSVTITGTCDGDTTGIDIYEGATKKGSASASDGAWTYTYTNNTAGDYTITAKATATDATSPASDPITITMVPNLALSKTVESSSSPAANPAGNVVNGIGASAWNNLGNDNPFSVSVNLGTPQEVNEVTLSYHTTNRVKNFKIQYSADNIAWQNAYVHDTAVSVSGDPLTETYAFPPVTAKHIRFIAEKSSSGAAGLTQFEIYNNPSADPTAIDEDQRPSVPPGQTAGDLAYGKTVNVGIIDSAGAYNTNPSSGSAALAGYPGFNAVDANPDSAWRTGVGAISGTAYPIWLTVDLGSSQTVTQANLGVVNPSFMKNIKLEYSADGTAWNTAYRDSGSLSIGISGNVDTTYEFPAVVGRYFRYTAYPLSGSTTNSFSGLSSFELFNASVTAVAAPVITTSSTTITATSFVIEGTCESGSAVAIYQSGVFRQNATIDPTDDTKWSYTMNQLVQGTYEITARATKSGIQSGFSDTFMLEVNLGLTRPPDLALNPSRTGASTTLAAGPQINAFDGDVTTRWTCLSGDKDNSYLWVDLSRGATTQQTFNVVRLNLFAANVDNVNDSISAVHLQTTTDVSAPTSGTGTAVALTPNPGTVFTNITSRSEPNDVEMFVFSTPVTTRYLRLQADLRLTPIGVYSFEVFNVDITDPDVMQQIANGPIPPPSVPPPAEPIPMNENYKQTAAAKNSDIVYPGADGRLVYEDYDDKHNQMPDFSKVGYKGGTESIPNVPVQRTLNPIAGSQDDTARIQAAINEISALPLVNGQRGALLLTAGRYTIKGTLNINASGVVIRGEGETDDGTVIYDAFNQKHPSIVFKGSFNTASVVAGASKTAITSSYVPVGAYKFNVANASGYSVGDQIIVYRPGTAAWLQAIGMDQLSNPWVASNYNLSYERNITKIEGNEITIDIPLVMELDQQYGGGSIFKFSDSGRISNVGIENIKMESYFLTHTDDAHGWAAVIFEAVKDGWAKNVTSRYYGYACVQIQKEAKRISVLDCNYTMPISTLSGSSRYGFEIIGQQNLVKNCYSQLARHDYVLNEKACGPNVFVDCIADFSSNVSEPHLRWSTGTLYDNIMQNNANYYIGEGTGGTGGYFQAINRNESGTGHGWAGANTVFWNVSSPSVIVQKPPTAQNFAIGMSRLYSDATMNQMAPSAAKFANDTSQIPTTYNASPQMGTGYLESADGPVLPNSLYAAQLEDRLNPVVTIKYVANATVIGEPQTIDSSLNATLTPADLTLPDGYQLNKSNWSYKVIDQPRGLTELKVAIKLPGQKEPSPPPSSSSSSDSAPSSPPPAPAPQQPWLEPSPAQILSNDVSNAGANNVRTNSTGTYGVRKGAFAALEGLTFHHDTLDSNRSVQVRLYINNPENIKNDIYVSGFVSGVAVDSRKYQFKKWFDNKIQVIHMDQTGSYGQTVKIAAKVDLNGMDIKNLYIYSYDIKTNKYALIKNARPRVDKNGYLHFYTQLAGDIVISNGSLKRKS